MAGPSKSHSESDQSTTVNTTTTTTVGDIGLTGQNAVDALAALENGIVARESIFSDLIKTTSANIERGYNNLGVVTQDVFKNFSASLDKNTDRAYSTVDKLSERDSTNLSTVTSASERMAARNVGQNPEIPNFVLIGGGLLIAAATIMAFKK